MPRKSSDGKAELRSDVVWSTFWGFIAQLSDMIPVLSHRPPVAEYFVHDIYTIDPTDTATICFSAAFVSSLRKFRGLRSTSTRELLPGVGFNLPDTRDWSPSGASLKGEGWIKTDRWMDGWMDGRMDGWTDGRMDGWTDGRMDGWTDGRMEEARMDGWTDAWMCILSLHINSVAGH